MIRELVADAQGDTAVAEQFRNRFFDERRRRARVVLERGIERGELRRDLELESVIDALFAPLWLRLLIGHGPLDTASADQILDLVWPQIEGSIGF